jgi:hypothetical protein
MTDNERTTKPTGGPAGPGSKGVHVEGQMGEPHSPTGPNEVDGDPSGVIPPAEQVPPGEDQVGLIGGDAGEAQTSQTGNPAYADARFAPKSEKDMKAKDVNDPNLPHGRKQPEPAHTAQATSKR